MRITNNITTQNALRTLQRGQRQIALASERVTTGLRFQRASEDPIAAAQVMRTSGSLRALEQYRRNVASAQSRTAAEEGVLDQLSTVLTRANELAVSQATGTASAETRAVVKAEVDQLLRFAVSLGNTRHGDAYLFGGAQAAMAPFTLDESDPDSLDFTATGATGEHTVEISAGQLLSTNHDGGQVFGDAASGPLAALRELSRALGANDQDAIGAAADRLKGTLDDTQVLIGDIGARTNQLEITASNLDALKVTLTTYKSDLQEVDFEQAVTELVGRQTAFQAAMMATSRVIGMNLTDYLR
ncbi:MAG TPA: flagellar hook-associated protein FlgL [Gemmatimonadaceae bacterium]|nr:flagellar hook-associated protein FlgL [Gemmatimonadaceae bacterium]